MQPQLLPSSLEKGNLQIMHLKRYWYKAILKRAGKLDEHTFKAEAQLDKILIYALGLGLEQTITHLYRTGQTLEEFENWIIETAGTPSPETVTRFNNILSSAAISPGRTIQKVFTDDDLDFFHQHGYVILREAVPEHFCKASINAICNFIEIDKDDPATWYNEHPGRQGVMVQLFQHPALHQTRQSTRVRNAFEQLWNRTDLWVTVDRVGFNPPETKTYKYKGNDLHWDVSLQLPIPFGLQGLVYLSDTAANQGAFTLVPGFQHRLPQWLQSLPAGANPRNENIYALGAKPIAANAGDLIIWRQDLPHGSSPNTSNLPRYVQYINYIPADYHPPNVWL